MSRECPVEVPCVCVVSSAPRRLWLRCVSGQGSAVGGVGLWPVVTCPQRSLPVRMPGPWYGRIPGRVMLLNSPGRMANAVPAQPEAYPDVRCLCPRRYIHGPANVVPETPPFPLADEHARRRGGG